MIKNISVGIDVGSSVTRVVVGEFLKGEKDPKVLGVGESPSLGLRRGYVTNPALATESIKNAVALAERSSGVKIKRAFVSLSGSTLRGDMSSGSTIISKADGEVTTLDVNKALQDCEDNLNLGNKKVIHVYPISFRLDGKEVLGRLEGMRGTKLEAKALFVTYSIVHLEDLLGAIAEAGVEAVDVVAAPIATAALALSEKQKIVGVALVSIGDQVTTLSVFENGLLLSIATFSIGSSDITNDIAIGFKISLEGAEELKRGGGSPEFSAKKLDEIIEARLCDIFESIENHLKKIKRSELLPAGIIFVGGGAHTPGLIELSKSVLKLPAGLGTTDIWSNTKTKLRDSSWFVSYGLALLGKENGDTGRSRGTAGGNAKGIFKEFLRQFLP